MFSQALQRQQGLQLIRRESRNMSKYEQLKLLRGSVVKVVPLVMEYFESWREEARKFLQKLAAVSSDEARRPNAAEFLDFWRKSSLYNYRSVMFKLYQRNLACCTVGLRCTTLSAHNIFLISLSYI